MRQKAALRSLTSALGLALIVSACTTVPEATLDQRYAGTGVVTLECAVAPDGAVGECRVLSETPPGQGFGRAAVEGAQRARLNPRSGDAKVRFTIRFEEGKPAA
ncbi:TonB family protein [uncultured Brevundimonas sp.]|uniref:TonB family protein n=1 Tax=uncultured Brevundimonas sp. TaxID=213418 RepID=UPI0034508BAA